MITRAELEAALATAEATLQAVTAGRDKAIVALETLNRGSKDA